MTYPTERTRMQKIPTLFQRPAGSRLVVDAEK